MADAGPTFISRADAVKRLRYTSDSRHWRLRNYELEHNLELAFGGKWCISEWCPFNGRFCQLQDFVKPPHPPMSGEPRHPPETDIPWRIYSGDLVVVHVQSDIGMEEAPVGPCTHPGCMSHVTHPCEGCGRQWGSR